MIQQHFTVKPEHLALLSRAYVRWDDVEYGAPAIDSKRPYGNSSVAEDIAEILGWEPEGFDGDEPALTVEQHDLARKIHEETQVVLQIALATGRFEAGDYTAPQYSNQWRSAS